MGAMNPYPLLEKRAGLLVGIVRGAVLQFAFGFVPEFVFAPLRSPGDFPQMVRAESDLLFGRIGHGVNSLTEDEKRGQTGVTPYGRAGDCPAPDSISADASWGALNRSFAVVAGALSDKDSRIQKIQESTSS